MIFSPGEKLAAQVRFLQAHPEVDALGTHITAVKGDGTPHEDGKVGFVDIVNAPWDVADLENWEWTHKLWLPSVLYRREFWR